MKEVIIDVREQDEYKAERIENSINLPLSHFATVAPGALSNFMDSKVIIMCRSGKRAELAMGQARQLGFEPAGGFEVYSGGILKWKQQLRPVISGVKHHLPILRQTHLAAGLIALFGAILGFTVHPGFFLMSGFVGLGLTVAGATGLCLMSEILAKMPWNKNIPDIKREVCAATKGDSSCQTI
ncbi:MAG: hypothetical protein COT74_10865 [Bdellovibrionales bacterium CG10_big_fil_rev_8_21_14_0_10_45_34]|nr:MAG: hypothetical protein COT74_10865 [Bdellovibrionales bacterium CG10_big_fil_rev_8_21_14_0_10_45_34]